MALTPQDLDRHARHIMLKEIGGPGVQALKGASVSIIGAGALGGPCAMYLAAAGIGAVEVWDDDLVERSNLQRQVQFDENDIGKPKVEALARRLEAMNPWVQVEPRAGRFGAHTPLSGELLIDASDNYPTRFALNAAAHRTGRLLISGAASRWSGQVSVYASGVREDAPCYQCFVPEAPPETEACEEVGVVGPVTGFVAARMALETVKIITGAGRDLSGSLWIFDGLSGEGRVVRMRPAPDCPICAS